MAVVFVIGVLVCAHFEYAGNPSFPQQGLSSALNLEGKEARFGVFNSALFATVTTDASCGAVNAMHDSFTPLGGLVPFVNIMLGEIIFGGVGSGLYGMIMFIILTVFIAGLMVGRTPEYCGKKIEGREVKYAMLAIIVMALCILGFGAWALLDAQGVAGIGNPNAHGLSEVAYAFTSATGNNGSAFAGLNTNTPYYNVLLAVAMFVGRFFVAIPLLGIAGSMAAKRYHPESAGTFPVYGPMFIVLLLGVIVIVGALTYFPLLSLGPIAEHFQMRAGQWF
jgi:K+-transporting ATPase ATPase A chain